MFDIGATELLVIAIVAILVIGPKDLPMAMRTAGRWIGKFRRTTAHVRTGIDAMVREAEMEDLDQKWRERNAKIMAEYPDEQMTPLDHETGETGGLSAAEARKAQSNAQGKAAKAEPAIVAGTTGTTGNHVQADMPVAPPEPRQG